MRYAARRAAQRRPPAHRVSGAGLRSGGCVPGYAVTPYGQSPRRRLIHHDHTLARFRAVEFLEGQTVYHDSLGAVALVVLTDESGASRVYETRGRMFSRWDSQDGVWDESGARWTLSEPALTGPDQTSLRRLPSHRAFWFGWYAQYPETRLVY